MRKLYNAVKTNNYELVENYNVSKSLFETYRKNFFKNSRHFETMEKNQILLKYGSKETLLLLKEYFLMNKNIERDFITIINTKNPSLLMDIGNEISILNTINEPLSRRFFNAMKYCIKNDKNDCITFLSTANIADGWYDVVPFDSRFDTYQTATQNHETVYGEFNSYASALKYAYRKFNNFV